VLVKLLQALLASVLGTWPIPACRASAAAATAVSDGRGLLLDFFICLAF